MRAQNIVLLQRKTQDLIEKVNKDYDEGMQGTNHGEKDAEQAKWEMHITSLMNKEDAELKGL